MAEKAVPALATGLQLLGPELIPVVPCLHAGAAGSHWGRGMGEGALLQELPLPPGGTHSGEGLRQGRARGMGILPAI